MSEGFKTSYTRIKGLSDRRRLPRLGKIRLGIKVPNKGKDPSKCDCRGSGCYKCTHPIETPYFVCPKEVQAKYGEKPTQLRVMLPVNDIDVVFPCRLVWYGASRGPKCMGNGEQASRVQDDGSIKEIPCPCEKLEAKQCHQNSRLFVMLYEVNFGGVYEISSGSTNSMIDIPSGLDYTQAILGRFAMVPLFLSRVATETHYEGKKAIHYPLRINLETNDPQFINALRLETSKVLTEPRALLPAPDSLNPDLEGPINTEWREAEDGDGEAHEHGTADEPAPLTPPSPINASGGGQPGGLEAPKGNPADDPPPSGAAAGSNIPAVFRIHTQIKGVTFSQSEPDKFKILTEHNILMSTKLKQIAQLCKDVSTDNPRPYLWLQYVEERGEKRILSATRE